MDTTKFLAGLHSELSEKDEELRLRTEMAETLASQTDAHERTIANLERALASQAETLASQDETITALRQTNRDLHALTDTLKQLIVTNQYQPYNPGCSDAAA